MLNLKLLSSRDLHFLGSDIQLETSLQIPIRCLTESKKFILGRTAKILKHYLTATFYTSIDGRFSQTDNINPIETLANARLVISNQNNWIIQL